MLPITNQSSFKILKFRMYFFPLFFQCSYSKDIIELKSYIDKAIITTIDKLLWLIVYIWKVSPSLTDQLNVN